MCLSEVTHFDLNEDPIEFEHVRRLRALKLDGGSCRAGRLASDDVAQLLRLDPPGAGDEGDRLGDGIVDPQLWEQFEETLALATQRLGAMQRARSQNIKFDVRVDSTPDRVAENEVRLTTLLCRPKCEAGDFVTTREVDRRVCHVLALSRIDVMQRSVGDHVEKRIQSEVACRNCRHATEHVVGVFFEHSPQLRLDRTVAEPKTILGFLLAFLGIATAAVVAVTIALVIAGHVTEALIVMLGGFLLAIAMFTWAARTHSRNPTALMLGHVTARDFLAYQQWTAGDSAVGEQPRLLAVDGPLSLPPGELALPAPDVSSGADDPSQQSDETDEAVDEPPATDTSGGT